MNEIRDTDDTAGGHGTAGVEHPIDTAGGDGGDVLGIGAFARLVGLSPSALRYYDDCDVLRPASVDEATGYRSYTPDQAPRARLLRGLRAVDVPLTEVVAVLDGPPAEAEALLRAHVARMRDRANAARSSVEQVLRTLAGPGTRAVVGGPEWASAVRQVSPAAGGGAGELAVLDCVLVEIADDEVRLVATDRYRLSIRGLPALRVEGVAASAPVRVDDLVATLAWARGHDEVEIGIGEAASPPGLRLRAGDEERVAPVFEGTYPAYRDMLDALPAPSTRVIVDRAGLRDAILADEAGSAHVLSAVGDTLRVSDAVALPAIHTGPPLRMAFAASTLVPALDASVGPDVLIEVSAPPFPARVRSADQGTFTTLVMPVALPDSPGA